MLWLLDSTLLIASISGIFVHYANYVMMIVTELDPPELHADDLCRKSLEPVMRDG
jgi:hypothetical protein